MNDFKRESRVQKFGDVIDKLLKSYGLEKKMRELDALQGWEEMMGTAIARRTKELYIRNRILFIKLDSSVIRDELSRGKSIIIMRVNQFANEKIIDDVWFQ